MKTRMLFLTLLSIMLIPGVCFAKTQAYTITPNQWNLIGVSVSLDNATIGNHVTWDSISKIAKWTGSGFGTAEGGSFDAFTTFDPGLGYFVQGGSSSYSFNLTGNEYGQLPTLGSGWNLVNIPVNAIGTVSEFMSLFTSAGWAIDKLAKWTGTGYGTADGGSFDAFSSFDAGVGFWVNVTTTQATMPTIPLFLVDNQITFGDQTATVNGTSGSFGTVSVASAQATQVAAEISGNGETCNNTLFGLKVADTGSSREMEVVFGGYSLQPDGTVAASSPMVYMDGTDSGGNTVATSGGIATDLATGPVYNENGVLKVSFSKLTTLFSNNGISQFDDILKPGTYTVTLYVKFGDMTVKVNKSELGATETTFGVDDTAAPSLSDAYKISGTVTVN